jgi:hypothetical protein
MDFADSPEHAAFRGEFPRWLEQNLPAELCTRPETAMPSLPKEH